MPSKGAAAAATPEAPAPAAAPTAAPATEPAPACEVGKKEEEKEIVIVSPLKGNAMALADVPDPTFAEGVLGQGAAVEPSEGKVVAPADAEVTTLFDTKHAIGLQLDNGAELLIHIGINTVEMEGDGFEAHVKEGDKVKKGDTLVTFDIDKIKAAGHPTVTPVIVTNTDDYSEVTHLTTGDIDRLADIVKIVK